MIEYVENAKESSKQVEMKNLGINLTKLAKDLYAKNYKLLIKENKKIKINGGWHFFPK